MKIEILSLPKLERQTQTDNRKEVMNKILSIAAISLSMLSTMVYAQQPVAGAVHAAPTSKAKKLTNAEFDALVAHPDQVLLIDVRRPDEITTIGGFPVYLSIQIKDLKNHLSEIPKDRQIITVSNHASRAGVAADILADAGFKVAGAVGAQTYEADGGKLLKIAIPPSHAATTASNK
jgi:rhodanese-related sulfurtransferase